MDLSCPNRQWRSQQLALADVCKHAMWLSGSVGGLPCSPLQLPKQLPALLALATCCHLHPTCLQSNTAVRLSYCLLLQYVHLYRQKTQTASAGLTATKRALHSVGWPQGTHEY